MVEVVVVHIPPGIRVEGGPADDGCVEDRSPARPIEGPLHGGGAAVRLAHVDGVGPPRHLLVRPVEEVPGGIRRVELELIDDLLKSCLDFWFELSICDSTDDLL